MAGSYENPDQDREILEHWLNGPYISDTKYRREIEGNMRDAGFSEEYIDYLVAHTAQPQRRQFDVATKVLDSESTEPSGQ